MIFAKALDMIYPRRCPACHDAVLPRGGCICAGHAERFSYVSGPVCMRCGKEIGDEEREYCYDCTEHPKCFTASVSLMNYDRVAQASMSMFKFSGRREYAEFYARAIYERLGDQLRSFEPQLMVPVPIHLSKRIQRGYNQAAEICRYLAPLLDIPVREDILVRGRRTEALKGLGGSAAREKTLQGAFSVTRPLTGVSSVLVVDDIYTTGSTMDACASALLAAGANKVFGCTVCIGRDS